MTTPGRAAVIFNPVAGARRGYRVAAAAVDHQRERGWRADAFSTSGPGGAEDLAREFAADVDLLVVAGGDGSLREAIQGLGEARTRVVLGFVPIGNANVVARELAIPRDERAAIQLLSEGVPTLVDLGRMRLSGEDEFESFLAVVGVGWDARTVATVDRIRHSTFGSRWYSAWADSAYLASGLLALAMPSPRLRVVADGHELGSEYFGVHLCNFRTYAKGMAMTPGASFRSGRIHFQARKRSAPPAVAWHFAAAALGVHSPRWLSDYGDGLEFAVESENEFSVQIDGDFRGMCTGLEVRILPEALRILAPAALATQRPSS
jgi:diacylglycerol kinase (ATP)